jgi:2-(1,2-epoxy-1,2-dihydrophenyl)acetyl-CoA isomerase
MSQPSSGVVKVERDGPVAIFTLSYPERRNALSLPLRLELLDRLRAANTDPDCRAIVITGEGGHFCSGGDVSSFDSITPLSGRERLRLVHDIVREIIRGATPVIAAVEGHAAGAGLCLAAACDIVVASRDAKFSCTFNRIGMMPDAAGVWSLPQRMGLGKAKLMMMSGRVVGGEAAERDGLVDQLAEPGQALADARALAAEIAQTAPLSHAVVKSVLARGPGPLEEALAAELDGQALLYSSEDFQEGRTAFMQKRPAVFRGR